MEEYIASVQYFNKGSNELVGSMNFSISGQNMSAMMLIEKINNICKEYLKKHNVDITKTNIFIVSVSKL